MALWDGPWNWMKKLWDNTETGYKQYHDAASNQLPGMMWDIFMSKKLSESTQQQMYGESDKSGIERALLRFSGNTQKEVGGLIGKPLSSLESVPVLGSLLRGYDRLMTYGVKRPLATAWVAPQYGSPFDSETWRNAWNASERVTPGQAAVWGFTGNDPKYDPRTPEGQEHYYNDALFQYTSGSVDTALTFVDPLKGAGKVGKLGLLSAAASKVEPIANVARKTVEVTGMAPSQKLINQGYLEKEAFGAHAQVGEGFVEAGSSLTPSYQKLYDSAQKYDLATYQRLHFNDQTFGGTVATTSWAMANMGDKGLFADSLMASRGSYDAFVRFQKVAPEVANRIGRDKQALNLATSMNRYADDPAAKLSVDANLRAQFDGWLDSFGRDLQTVGTDLQNAESFWNGLPNSIQGSGKIRANILQRLRVGLHEYVMSSPVAVGGTGLGSFLGGRARAIAKFVDPAARYDSLINVNAQSSYRNFRYNLDRSPLEAPDRNGLMARYMLAPTAEERSKIIAEVDARSLRVLQKNYGLTDAEYKQLVQEMSIRRASALDMLRKAPRHIPTEFLAAGNRAMKEGRAADAKRMNAYAKEFQKLVDEGKIPATMDALPVSERGYLGLADNNRGYLGDKPQMRSTTANLSPMMDYRALELAFKRELAPTNRTRKRLADMADADPTGHLQDLASAEFWKRSGQFTAALNAVQKVWAITALLRPAQFIRSIADDGMRAMVWHGMTPYMMHGMRGAVRSWARLRKQGIPYAMAWAQRRNAYYRGRHWVAEMPDVNLDDFKLDAPSGLAGDAAGFYQLSPVTTGGAKVYKSKHAKTPTAADFDTMEEALVHGVITPKAYAEAVRYSVANGKAPWGLVQLVEQHESGWLNATEFERHIYEYAMDQAGQAAYTNPAWARDFYQALKFKPGGVIASPRHNAVTLQFGKEPAAKQAKAPKGQPHPFTDMTLEERAQALGIDPNNIDLEAHRAIEEAFGPYSEENAPPMGPKPEGGPPPFKQSDKPHPGDTSFPPSATGRPFSETGWFPDRATSQGGKPVAPDEPWSPSAPYQELKSGAVGGGKRAKTTEPLLKEFTIRTGRNVYEKYDAGPTFKIPVDATDGSYRFQDLQDFLSDHASDILEKGYLVHGRRTDAGHMQITLVRERNAPRTVAERMTVTQRRNLETGVKAMGQDSFWFNLGGAEVRVRNAFAGMQGNWLRESTGSGTDVTSAFASWLALKQTSKHLIIGEGNVSVKPVARTYPVAWEYTANNLVGNDPVMRLALEGKSYSDILAWTDTGPGRTWVKTRQQKGVGVEDQVRDLMNMAYKVVPDVGDLRTRTLAHDAKFKDLEGAYPDIKDRPDVLGPSDLIAMGRFGFSGAVRQMTDKWFRWMSDMPIDRLTRHPFVETEYHKVLEPMLNNYRDYLNRTGGSWTQAEVDRLEGLARHQALDQSERVLYDTMGRTDAAQAMQLFMPFASAVADSYFKWARIAWKRPLATTRMWYRYWMAPDRSGLVYDQDGYYLQHNDQGDDRWISPVTGEESPKFEPDGVTPRNHEKYVLFRMPKMGGKQIMGAPGKFLPAFNKDSMNPILSLPTAGPIVAIPANQFLIGKPEIADKWWIKTFVLPFGVTDDSVLQQASAGPFRTATRWWNENQDSAQSTAMQIYQMSLVEYAKGERAAPLTIEEAKSQAKHELGLRFGTSLVSPVSLQYYNPYKPYQDYYHMLVEKHKGNEDEAMIEFRANAMDDYIYLAAHVTRANVSLPATMGAYESYKKNEALIQAHPELTGLIVGADGAGSFNKAVYEWQKTLKINGKPVREVMTIDESMDALNKRATWSEYSKFMDQIDMELEQRGVGSIRSRGALDLAAARQAWIDDHKLDTQGTGLSAWYQDYMSTDASVMEGRLLAMKDILNHEDLVKSRPDLQSLNVYIMERERMRKIMDSYRFKSLSASKAGWLSDQWDSTVASLKNDLAFADLYNRWLTRDDLSKAMPGGGN